MIGDLTGAPQPVVVKLFSPDAALLDTWAPQVAAALDKITINNQQVVVDVANGIDNHTSGPAVVFTVNPDTAARTGFATDDLRAITAAIMEGQPAAQPVLVNDRPYSLRVRFPEGNRATLEAMQSTMLVNSAGGTATLVL